MTNAKKEQVALARFAVIFPLLAPNPAYGDQSRLLEEICSKHYQFTGRRATTVCAATVLNWLRAYIAGGRTVESLYPSDRKDKGRGRRLDSATEADLKRLRDMNPDIKLTTLVTKAVKERTAYPWRSSTGFSGNTTRNARPRRLPTCAAMRPRT